MCGIGGIVRVDERAPAVSETEAIRIRDAMEHRGPDGAGLWTAADGGVTFCHRRLAILDLSDAGAQPMATADGRYRIVFNGEIYNFRELRAELESRGVSFRTRSDTEVILSLWEREGTDALKRLRGMFALAVWDTVARRLVLARDLYGIKPLYLSSGGGHLRFASQVRALEAGGSVPFDLDPAGVTGFLLWGSVPEPWTLRRSIRAVPAGHYVVVEPPRVLDPEPFDRLAESGPTPVPESDRDAVSRALFESVRFHLVSDVPVAIFLSAGLDSGLIAALASRARPEPPTTITLRFDEFAGGPLDEAPLAAEVARALGTRHIERTVSRTDFLDLLPRALCAMDQPSIDGFNTYVVSCVAADAGFKVVLSGLGGDELFGGYPSFADVPAWRARALALARVPLSQLLWPPLAGLVAPRRPKLAGLVRYGRSLPGAYFLRRALFLPEDIAGIVGAELAAEGLAAYTPVAGLRHAVETAGADLAALDADPFTAVHLMESVQYMRNQLLRDSDWASMAHSVELRVPFVDATLRRRVRSAQATSTPPEAKASVVRRAAPELPDVVFSRPKSGFSMPVMEWVAGDERLRTRHGQASRALARHVLETFGVPVR